MKKLLIIGLQKNDLSDYKFIKANYVYDDSLNKYKTAIAGKYTGVNFIQLNDKDKNVVIPLYSFIPNHLVTARVDTSLVIPNGYHLIDNNYYFFPLDFRIKGILPYWDIR